MENSEKLESSYISPECFHAYVSAELKVPNTLVAVGPYVGHAALKSITAEADVRSAVEKFANTYAFSQQQMASLIQVVVATHGKFGLPVVPEGAELADKAGVRFFKQERFEVVYMEGVFNILQAILLLHGVNGHSDDSRAAQVAKIFVDSDNLAATIEVFAAAERAVNSPEATEHAERFKEIFNFTKTGEKPRAMFPAEKDAIQTATMPFIIAAVRNVFAARKFDISEEQIEKFVFVLTSPELYQGA